MALPVLYVCDKTLVTTRGIEHGPVPVHFTYITSIRRFDNMAFCTHELRNNRNSMEINFQARMSIKQNACTVCKIKKTI